MARIRLDMMRSPLVEALIDALKENPEIRDLQIEETPGGMVLIGAEGTLKATSAQLQEIMGVPVNLEDLNVYTVAIVGHTKHWTSESFEVSDE